MEERKPNFIVGIGGSAGALDAYRAVLSALPTNTGMAFIIISHMQPAAYSQLALILSRHTKMPVVVAKENMPIQSNHVYVIAPDEDLTVVNYTFKVVTPRSRRNKQIDLFFISLAESMKASAVGIVFSGYDGDGTEGCKQIKLNGGTTFAQDESAAVEHMPRNAQLADTIDFVMAPAKIAKELKKLALRMKRKS